MVNVWRSIRFTIVFAVLLGLVYPLAVTGLGNLFFPFQAKGSIVEVQGQPVGSVLIAQDITNPGLFHARPSAVNYAANASGGSNLGPTNPALLSEVGTNLKGVEQQNPGVPTSSIPPDMVESSASGLDPDISLANAFIQIPRIAKATGISQVVLQNLVHKYEVRPSLGIWGDSMVNVMTLNFALEKLGRG